MSYVNNWCDTDWCHYEWCTPIGTNVLNSQVRWVTQGSRTLHAQVKLVAYNITQLRILWEIKSDGIELGNFTSSSDASGDKAVVNVKSDIVEKYWQSSSNTNEWVQWDSGLGNVIFLDTFALISHNLSSSAVVTLKGYGSQSDSAPSDWSVVPVYATLTMSDDPDETNLVWISPSLPTSSYRHWRLFINDPTNTNPYLRIGRLLGGAALIFNGENCLDQISYDETSFKDEMRMNGFTGISNNRALKKHMKLSFQNLDTVSKNNYRLLKRYLRYCRDTLKALVIVDPSTDTLKYKYTVFSKLKAMPSETHNFIDSSSTYTTLDLEYDEAR